MSFANLIEILDGPVYRSHGFDRSIGPDFIQFFQQIAMFQRQIGHLVNRLHLLVVQPRGYLLGRKGRHAQLFHQGLKLGQCHSQKRLFLHIYGIYVFLFAKILKGKGSSK